MTSRIAAATLAAAIALTATACTLTPASDVPAQLVLADGQELGQFNPAAGYAANGVSPIYEGLLAPRAADDNQLPDLEPALAAAPPEVSSDGKTWTVKLRGDIPFSDGTALDSGDVAAIYRNVMDPATGSPIADDYTVIDRIDTPDDLTVVFHLKEPVGGFASRLLLGIPPSEKITPGPATESPLNTDPVGTGPYRLDRLDPGEATLVANDSYRGEKPQVNTLVLRSVSDENSRAQQLLSGDIQGAALPPHSAKSIGEGSELALTVVRSADWRAVSFPADNPATDDPAMRMAINAALDREAMVDQVLAGFGEPALSPFSSEYGLAGGQFPSLPAAEDGLRAAGWAKGGDGIWHKGPVTARFTLAYPAQDSLRRELASAFADQMRDFGVEVELWGASWDDIEARRDVGILLGGGDNPYTADTQAYRVLHSRGPATGVFDNPGAYSDSAVDAALEKARSSQEAEATVWQPVQDAYLHNPGYAFLTFVHHTYVSQNYARYQVPHPILEPHSHGVTWGPWFDVAGWRMR